MHQTTVRFGPDLWEALEVESARLGVSVAHYVRESALARLAYTAGRRGEQDYEYALVGASAASSPDGREAASTPVRMMGAQLESAEQRDAASAVTAQSELIWRRAREVRARAVELRSRVHRKAAE